MTTDNFTIYDVTFSIGGTFVSGADDLIAAREDIRRRGRVGHIYHIQSRDPADIGIKIMVEG